MQESLLTLFQLQRIDQQMYELEHLKVSIPVKIESLNTLLSEAETQLLEKENRFEELEKLNRQNERDIEASNDQIAKYQGQLHSVKTNKEYDSLQHEIQAQKVQIKELEDGILELLDELETLTMELEQARTDGAVQKERITEECRKLEEQLAHVDEDVQVKQDERIRTQMHVVGGVLSAYNRIRKGRKQDAVVPLKKGACGGCFHVIPLQQVAEIKQMKRLVDCEACGRILVPETGTDA